jgi:hypothetical protein
VLRLRFHRGALRDWCLGLTLLNEGLIENLSVTGERRTKGVQVQLGAKADGVGPVRVSLKSDPIRVEITPNRLDYLQPFFLSIIAMAWRRWTTSICKRSMWIVGRRASTLRSKVPNARRSVSAGELERRLRS